MLEAHEGVYVVPLCFRWIAALLIPLLLPGCTKWTASNRPIEEVLKEEPKEIRVILNDTQWITFEPTQATPDSLFGTNGVVEVYRTTIRYPVLGAKYDEPEVCLALPAPGEFEVRTRDRLATLFLLVPVVAAAILVFKSVESLDSLPNFSGAQFGQ